MSDPIPVAVILTTLNEAATVDSFFNSLSRQSRQPAEVVICDGGSKDGTIELIQQEIARHANWKLAVESGATIARGRNRAIELTSMSICAITDAGCSLHDDWLEKIVAQLIANSSVDAVAGGYTIAWRTPFQRIASIAEVRVEDIPPHLFLPSSRSFAIRKHTWQEVGGYPQSLTFAGEDTALCARLLRAKKTIARQLDARVDWYPRASLRSYIKQHFFYGLGDAESNERKAFYLKIILKSIASVTLITAGFWVSLFFAALPVAALVYYWYLRPIYRWSETSTTDSIFAFLLIILKELSMLTGWVRGKMKRSK